MSQIARRLEEDQNVAAVAAASPAMTAAAMADPEPRPFATATSPAAYDGAIRRRREAALKAFLFPSAAALFGRALDLLPALEAIGTVSDASVLARADLLCHVNVMKVPLALRVLLRFRLWAEAVALVERFALDAVATTDEDALAADPSAVGDALRNTLLNTLVVGIRAAPQGTALLQDGSPLADRAARLCRGR